MTSPRWKKVVADLRVSRSRTILVILSIAIGVFAIGTVLTARDVLQRGVDESFEAANSASAVLMTGPFEAEMVEAARALPAIGDAEGRVNVPARLQRDDGTWSNLALSAIADYGDIRIDRIIPEEGAWPPVTGELLLERKSAADVGLAIGDEVVIETGDGQRFTLRVGGLAYDPGEVDPAIGNGRLAGYITRETLVDLGQPAAFNELRIRAAENPGELRQGEHVAALARDLVLEPNGVTVQRIAVHDTPRYHSAALGDALMLILGLMGGLVLLLGVFLVINTMSALLAQQVRQIGMMKAIGGQQRQIAAVYVALVLAYGLLAVAVAAPLSALAAREFAGFFAQMLNIEARGPWLPPTVVAIQLVIGLLVPLLAALVPVIRGTRITVREAITSYGISEGAQGGVIDRLIERARAVPRPVRLSIRNTFRRRGRLALTLATLTLGGAIFASVATVQTSLTSTLDEVMQYSGYDVEVTLQRPEPVTLAVTEAEALPGVTRAEGWIATNAARQRPDGTQNSNIWMMAPPSDSAFVQPSLIEGRWMQPGEGAALMVNVDFLRDEPDVKVGDLVTLRVEGRDIQWPVIGVVTSQLMGPVVYAPYEPFSDALGIAGEANRIVMMTEQRDARSQAEVARLAEQQLQTSGLLVGEVDTASGMREGPESAFRVLVVMLLIVGLLLAVVGALGLMGAMSLNVIERTREIGVMRAIGASNGMVARIVIVEGLVVGLLGWLFAGVLALPLSWGLSYAIGIAFLQSPLDYSFSVIGLLLWLAVVIVLSVVASVLPARSAWRLSVREVLAYE
jgi:putative ABC transport system permease protein